MKQPREIEYPNTRLTRSEKGRATTDLQSIANSHYDNASKISEEINNGRTDGWKFFGDGAYGGNRPQFKYKDDYVFDVGTKEMYPYGVLKTKEPRPNTLPSFDESKIKEYQNQMHLGDLAFASDQFGRDLYHDAGLRSGERKLYDVDGLKERKGFHLESLSDEGLEDIIDRFGAYLETVPEGTWGLREGWDEYREALNELARRRHMRDNRDK